MDGISTALARIGDIISVIEGIAFQSMFTYQLCGREMLIVDRCD
jgi:hypothetical protein